MTRFSRETIDLEAIADRLLAHPRAILEAHSDGHRSAARSDGRGGEHTIQHASRRCPLRARGAGSRSAECEPLAGLAGGRECGISYALRAKKCTRLRINALLLVTLSLQELSLLVLAHLLAAFLDHTTQRISPHAPVGSDSLDERSVDGLHRIGPSPHPGRSVPGRLQPHDADVRRLEPPSRSRLGLETRLDRVKKREPRPERRVAPPRARLLEEEFSRR